jgi:hypothetical protein
MYASEDMSYSILGSHMHPVKVCLRCMEITTDWTYHRCQSCGAELIGKDRYSYLVNSRKILVIASTGLMIQNRRMYRLKEASNG